MEGSELRNIRKWSPATESMYEQKYNVLSHLSSQLDKLLAIKCGGFVTGIIKRIMNYGRKYIKENEILRSVYPFAFKFAFFFISMKLLLTVLILFKICVEKKI